MTKVGVTGGRGFIGKWVTAELVDRGHEVVILDHRRIEHPEFAGVGQVEYLWGSVTENTDMMELAAHTDGIIHLAAVLGTQETMVDPRPSVLTNIMGGLNFLEALKRYDLPGVYICVGNHWMNNPYSISKTTVERFCHMYRDEHAVSVNQVRAVNAYGPRQDAAPPFAPGKVRKIMPAFICRALSGMPIEIYGSGEQVSDMVYVGDLAETLVTAWLHAARGSVYENVIECGPTDSCSVNQVAECVIVAAQQLGHNEVEIIHLPMRPGEVENDVVSADWSTLNSLGIDAHEFIPLTVGVMKTVDWFGNNEGVTWDNPD